MGYAVDEVLDFVKENDVKFIRLAFCDLFGVQKNISIMPNELKRAFEVGIPFDASAIAGFGNVVNSDLFLLPDPSTLNILPWRPQQGRVVRFYCDIKNPDGTDFEYDSRRILREAVKRCMDMGIGCRIGEETEFYLFKTDENGDSTGVPFDNGTYLDIAPNDKGENIRREICLCLEEMGIEPESSHHETGPGQNEIVFKPSDPLHSADHVLAFKNVVSSIAARNGLYASFLPKPILHKSGNGLHINISLYKDGVSLFDEENTSTVRYFMAGIMAHIREITLFLNTVPNSYDRFGEYEAPTFVTWSKENRSQLIRIPAATGEKRRFELRSPDPCVNPYLAFAMIIHAGLDGIVNKTELPPASDIDLTKVTSEDVSYETLPRSLSDAIELAKHSDFVRTTLGDRVIERYIRMEEHLLPV